MKRTLLTTLLMTSLACLAQPQKVEMWFISPEGVSFIKHHLQQNHSRLVAQVAQNDQNFKCVPMGDGCFHPQLGYVEKKPIKPLKKKKPALPTFVAVDRGIINCDKDFYFDMFCGKAQGKVGKTPPIELWIDTSSSMRQVDYPRSTGGCYRKDLAKKIMKDCDSAKVSISSYNTSRKEITDLDSLCINHGMNSTKRLIDWIAGSKVPLLIIVTDVFEISEDLTDYLASINATVRGMDSGNFTPSQMLKKAEEVITLCKKISK